MGDVTHECCGAALSRLLPVGSSCGGADGSANATVSKKTPQRRHQPGIGPSTPTTVIAVHPSTSRSPWRSTSTVRVSTRSPTWRTFNAASFADVDVDRCAVELYVRSTTRVMADLDSGQVVVRPADVEDGGDRLLGGPTTRELLVAAFRETNGAQMLAFVR